MKRQLLFAVKFLTLTGAYLFTRSRTPPSKLRLTEKSIAVLFLLENLKRFALHNAGLIRGAESQVEILENDIRLLRAFLGDCAGISEGDVGLGRLAERIQGAVRDGEAAISAFASHAAEMRDSSFLRRAICGAAKLVGVAKGVKAARAKVKGIYDESSNLLAKSGDQSGAATIESAPAAAERLWFHEI